MMEQEQEIPNEDDYELQRVLMESLEENNIQKNKQNMIGSSMQDDTQKNLEFIPIGSSPENSAQQPSFKCHSFSKEELLQNMQQIFARLSQKYDYLGGKVINNILLKCDFNENMANNKCADYDFKEICNEPFTGVCPTCYEPCNVDQMLRLQCGHLFCKICLRVVAELSLKEKTKISCGMCEYFIGPEEFNSFLNPQEVANYMEILVNAMVESALNSYRYCNNPNCARIFSFNYLNDSGKEHFQVKKTEILFANMKCACGESTCSLCHRSGHMPARCYVYEHYLKQTSGEGASELLIKATTQPCPKCKVASCKDERCAHVTCWNCKFVYCFICGQDWNKIGGHEKKNHNCNTMNPKEEIEAKQQLNPSMKLKNYKERFEKLVQVNMGFAKSSEKYKTEKLAQFNQMAKSFLEFKHQDDSFLIEALELIVDSRRKVAFSFMAALFCRENVKKFFAFQQECMTETLDKLSIVTDKKNDYFMQNGKFDEKLFLDWKLEIVTITSNLTRYTDNINDQISKGFPDMKQKKKFYNPFWEENQNKYCPKCDAFNFIDAKACANCDKKF